MANFDSDQIAALGGIPGKYGDGNAGGVYAPLDTTLLHGRMRVCRFTWTCPASAPAQNDVLFLNQMPVGALILKGYVWANSASFAATGCQIGFSDGVAADAYALTGSGGISLNTTTEVVFANTFATGAFVVPGNTPAPNTPGTSGDASAGQPAPYLLEMVPLIMTFSSGTVPVATYKISGIIQYVVD